MTVGRATAARHTLHTGRGRPGAGRDVGVAAGLRADATVAMDPLTRSHLPAVFLTYGMSR